MKNKILLRLIRYFVTSFVIFAVIIGVVFSFLFSRYNAEIHGAELERQAASIANSLSVLLEADYANNTGRGMMGRGMGMMNLNMYLQFIEDMFNYSAWIVDRDLEQIDFGNRFRHEHISRDFRDLPVNAEQVITDAFEGITSTSNYFSEFLEGPSITAASPIITRDGTVVGAVLLHDYLSDINSATSNGLTILMFSILTAIFISVFVAIILSTRFTKPLNKMKIAALQISSGNYDAKTGVNQLDEIGELAFVLDDMVDKLADASRERKNLDNLRREFIANVSHELRTPVTVIRGSLEALLDGVVSDADKTAEYHTQMLKECKYLERLVSDLLDLARLQNNDFTIEKGRVDLKDVAEDAVRSMVKLARQKEVSVDISCEENGFPAIGDYGRLRQMLIIVLENAIKFSPEAGKISIKMSKEDNIACINIQDQGCGIPGDDLEHIFERFYKQRSEQNKVGTGLGLAIAKQIADRHGVNISAENHDNGGAKFTFTIPLVSSE